MPAEHVIDLTADVVSLTRAICDIPSVSGDEASLADAIETALVPYPHLEVYRDGDLIVARTNLSRSRRVVIAGHIDTVPINANLPCRLTEELDGLTLWGRGTVDMKAGVAVQLKLAAELTEPAADITWIWYDHEEVDSTLNGLGRLARTRPELMQGDFAILGEPSNSGIEGGCNGTLRATVRATGRRSHAARAWVGENAIHKLAPALTKLAGYEAEIVTVDGLEYRESLSAVLIGGGVATNVIPDDAVITVNYRFAPSKSGAEASAFMTSFFDGFEVAIVDLAEGARPGLDSPFAVEFIAAVGAVPRPKYGWTDVARFSALGIPAVNFGPGDPMLAHTDDERVLTEQITACEVALRSWLQRA